MDKTLMLLLVAFALFFVLQGQEESDPLPSRAAPPPVQGSATGNSQRYSWSDVAGLAINTGSKLLRDWNSGKTPPDDGNGLAQPKF